MNKYEYIKRLMDFRILILTEDGKILRKIKLHRNGMVTIKARDITYSDNVGYKYASINIYGKSYYIYVHRIVWYINKGYIDDNLQINHKNGIKYDNRIENLELVTAKENVIHARDILKVMDQKGERNNRSKLTEDDVRMIKRLLNAKEKMRVIAEKFGVAEGTIKSIKYNKNWKHVK